MKENDPEVIPELHTIEENVKTALTPVLMHRGRHLLWHRLRWPSPRLAFTESSSFAVNRRLREVGIRMALGARRID